VPVANAFLIMLLITSIYAILAVNFFACAWAWEREAAEEVEQEEEEEEGEGKGHTPYTLRPTPYTLHPTTYTLHPKQNRSGAEILRVLFQGAFHSLPNLHGTVLTNLLLLKRITTPCSGCKETVGNGTAHHHWLL